MARAPPLPQPVNSYARACALSCAPQSANAPRLSAGEMVARIYRTEGVLAFYSGVVPAMLRQVSYGGLCFASYPPMRDFFTAAVARPDATHPPLWARIAAGAISGSVASVLASATASARS